MLCHPAYMVWQEMLQEPESYSTASYASLYRRFRLWVCCVCVVVDVDVSGVFGSELKHSVFDFSTRFCVQVLWGEHYGVRVPLRHVRMS